MGIRRQLRPYNLFVPITRSFWLPGHVRYGRPRSPLKTSGIHPAGHYRDAVRMSENHNIPSSSSLVKVGSKMGHDFTRTEREKNGLYKSVSRAPEQTWRLKSVPLVWLWSSSLGWWERLVFLCQNAWICFFRSGWKLNPDPLSNNLPDPKCFLL